MADGRRLNIKAIGKRSINIGGHTIELQKVHYADGLYQNLFCVKVATEEKERLQYSVNTRL